MKYKKLSDLTCKIGSGVTPRGGEKAYIEDGKTVLIRSQNIYNHTFTPEGLVYITEEQAEKMKGVEIESNDILMNITGDSVARVTIVPNKYIPSRVNQHVCIIRCKEGIDPYYILAVLTSRNVQRYLVSIAKTGGTRAALTKKMIQNIEIPILPAIDRDRISNIYKIIFEKIELNNQIIDTLEEMASTLFKRWFVDFEFPDENGNPYKSSGGKMIDSELGEIPEGWEMKRIKSIVTITRGASPRPIKDFIHNEGRPWIKISDANATFSPYIYDTKEFIKEEGVSKSKTVERDTLILSNSATPGIPKIVKMLSSVHDGWLIFDSFNELSKEFLYLFLIEYKKNILSLSNGSVFRNLKTDILKEFPIISPQKEEFEKFQLIVVELFSNINTLALEVLALESLRDALIPKLLSGELEV